MNDGYCGHQNDGDRYLERDTEPVTIRGEEFASPDAAALALGVQVSTVLRHQRAGTLDDIISRRTR